MKEAGMAVGSFSVEYPAVEEDKIAAADWNLWVRGRWIRSWKGKYSIYWHQEDDGGVLDQPAYEAILQRFGLESYKAELPLGKVQLMSPSALLAYRRAKGLPVQIVLSDTPGDHRSAEEYK